MKKSEGICFICAETRRVPGGWKELLDHLFSHYEKEEKHVGPHKKDRPR